MGRHNDLIGKKFGRLTVIEYAGNNKHRAILWKCICDCGVLVIIKGNSLRSGKTSSCGCKQREASSKNIRAFNKSEFHVTNGHLIHGGSHTDIYKIWGYMKTRCYNKNYEHYNRYGERGISVCQEWVNDFDVFRDWANLNGYKAGLEIDRKDNDRGYSPDNCKWSTRKEQVGNRINTVFLTRDGKTKTLIEWCEIFKINYKLAHARYRKGWCFEKIFNIQAYAVGCTFLDVKGR